MRFLPFLLIVGCGGTVIESTEPDAASDTSSADTSSTDSGFMLDEGVLDEGVETISACPEAQPAEGAACIGTDTVACPYWTCGGTLTMTCRDGAWTLVAKPPCETSVYCRQGKPADGSSCADMPEGRVCNYWPVSDTACVACTCNAGVWACKDGCDQVRWSCKGGTSCLPNTGCGLGMCNNFCGCGADGKLVCQSTLC
jgi:hypothetical protein